MWKRILLPQIQPGETWLYKVEAWNGRSGDRFNKKWYRLLDQGGTTFICRRANESERKNGSDLNGWMPVDILDQ